MSSITESMRRRIKKTEELGAVVHMMKVLAVANISQYEESMRASVDYHHTIVLGLSICLFGQDPSDFQREDSNDDQVTGLIVLGSDQGLVGQFNEDLAIFVKRVEGKLPGRKKMYVVGEHINTQLEHFDLTAEKKYAVPHSLSAITLLVEQLLIDCPHPVLSILYNRPLTDAAYESVMQPLLPLDDQWIRSMTKKGWITNKQPQALGDREETLSALIREYLFFTFFKACLESLTAENTCRLVAMQRAEKNIQERLRDLKQGYHRVRQNSIDEELFDVVAGFEALRE